MTGVGSEEIPLGGEPGGHSGFLRRLKALTSEASNSVIPTDDRGESSEEIPLGGEPGGHSGFLRPLKSTDK